MRIITIAMLATALISAGCTRKKVAELPAAGAAGAAPEDAASPFSGTVIVVTVEP